MSRRLLLIVLAAAMLAVAGCSSEPETITSGEGEQFYVTQGDLQYQVQISRQLNPKGVGDRDFLVGIPPADRGLKPGEIWFGVWVRAFNRSGEPARNTDEFTIVDTRGREYEPIELENVNVFAWRAALVNDGADYPATGSAAAGTSSTGALLLFKLPVDALSFRPLELEFGAGEPSTITLDV
jgi:hypothetical protein